LALQNRLEIREQEIQIELGEMSIKRQKAEGMIKSSLTAYFQKVGVSELGTDQGFLNSIDRSASDFMIRPQNYGVGLTVSVPIIDWGENKALVRSAESRLQKSLYRQEEVRRSIEREVLDLSNEVISSLKRLQLLEKNLVIAEKSFEITLARFSNGDIASQELALERERLNNAYTSHLSAYINYQLRMADLMRKTFYDFQNDRPIL
jgi:outer membrane protein TolC